MTEWKHSQTNRLLLLC